MADCDAYGNGASLSLTEAADRITAALNPINGCESLPIASAHGRVLADDVKATCDHPNAPRSAMDGYACRAEDSALATSGGLRLIGTSLAGHPFPGTCEAGTCVRITTGGVVPAGADCVVMQESCKLSGERVTVDRALKTGENVRAVGDELRTGHVVLQKGKLLNSADIGVLATLGLSDVAVVRRLRVAIVSTGDELRPIGQALQIGEIYDSNRYLLAALLDHPSVVCTDRGVLPDTADIIRDAFRDAADHHDVVISSGGVSVGDSDHVTSVLRQIGALAFWRIAIKPGKPFTFGTIGNAWFFGLPGNPVAVAVTFLKLVRPALFRLAGAEPYAPARIAAQCRTPIRKRPGRLEFVRGHVTFAENGQAEVEALPEQGSNQLIGLSRANCLITLPEDCAGVAAGETVLVEPLVGTLW